MVISTMHGSYISSMVRVPTLFSRVFSLLFFTQSTLEGLKAELPLYLSKADGVSTEVMKLHCMVASTCK